jgi:hypothetical protein
MKLIFIFISTCILGSIFAFFFLQFSPKSLTLSYSVPTPVSIPFKFYPEIPPKESLVGQVSTVSGEILWKSRTATQSSLLENISEIKQGESLVTKSDSRISVRVKDILALQIFPDSEIAFIQTLPQNIVLHQKTGMVFYNRLGSVPVSVRSLHLLTNIDGSDLLVTVDSDQKIIYLDLYSGTVTLAYNDLNYVTTSRTFSSGVRIIFNDSVRRLTVKKVPPKDQAL